MNKIASLHIENFTIFKKNTIEFSPGLNVFIGKNGTGKTHLLKVIYSFLMNFGRLDSQKFIDIFKVSSLSQLYRAHSKDFLPKIFLSFVNKQGYTMHLGPSRSGTFSDLNVFVAKDGPGPVPDSLYIPPQEMLSIFDGFIASWEKRENSFDETYYDLAKALSLSPLKDIKLMSELIGPLEKILKAKVIRENGRFYLEYEWGKIEAHLVAEGLRKLSQLIYLIGNGSINENTVLLWDEPEVHFNPSLIEAIVVLLRGLVDKGLQIFITTHDYLLSQRLSLISEYENAEFPIKFFCLENDGDNGVKIEEGTTLAEIDSNPILDEFAQYYDFERAAFYKVKK